MHPVYMVCGIPAAGKSWVCEQLTHKFTYVPNDDYIGRRGAQIHAIMRAAEGPKPVLIDCPFAEREYRAQLEGMGLTVHPYFIITPAEVAAERYESRGNGPLAKSQVTRATSIINRAEEWGAPRGSSAQILSMLRDISD